MMVRQKGKRKKWTLKAIQTTITGEDHWWLVDAKGKEVLVKNVECWEKLCSH